MDSLIICSKNNCLLLSLCFICLFVNFILVSVSAFPTQLLLQPSLLLLIHHSAHPSPSLFHSRLKTYLFHKSYPYSFTSSSWTAFMNYCLYRFFSATRFLILFFPYFFVSMPCARLSWPSRQLLNAC